MPKVKQRTVALRERGLASALAVLTEQGPAALTTRTVAQRAEASLPAIYEVFGDKAGLIREIFFHGFQTLGDELEALPTTTNPLEDLRSLAQAFRHFVITNPVLAEVMFSRPFADFDPAAEDNDAGTRVSGIFIKRASAASDAGLLTGKPLDIAHILFAFVQGLAAAESAHRIGQSQQDIERRWTLGLEALLAGLAA